MKKIILSILVGVAAFSFILPGCSTKKDSADVSNSESYTAKNADNPYYKKASDKLTQIAGLTDKEADEAFTIIEKSGILTEEVNNLFKKVGEDNVYTLWIGLAQYDLTFDSSHNLTTITDALGSPIYKNGVVIIATAPTEVSTQAIEKATKAPATTAAPISFTNYTNYVEAGSNATVTIQGVPNTEYRIHVYYNNGESSAQGLEPKTSDENGVVTWEWKVGANTNPGTHAIKVVGGGAENSVQFEVLEKL